MVAAPVPRDRHAHSIAHVYTRTRLHAASGHVRANARAGVRERAYESVGPMMGPDDANEAATACVQTEAYTCVQECSCDA